MKCKLEKLRPEDIGEGLWVDYYDRPVCLEGWLGHFLYGDPRWYQRVNDNNEPRDDDYMDFMEFIDDQVREEDYYAGIGDFNDSVTAEERADMWNSYVDFLNDQ